MNDSINSVGAAFLLYTLSAMTMLWLVDFFIDLVGRD